MAVLQNGDFLVIGRLGYAVRISPEGNVIWLNRYLVGQHTTHYVSALERPDGKLVLWGHASTTEAPGPFYNAAVVVRLAPDGTVLGGSASRQRMVPGGTGCKQCNRGALAPDGGLVLAGQLSILVYGQVVHHGMHVMKTTDDLLLGCEDEQIPAIQTLPITAPATTITGLSAGTWAVPHTALVPERVYALAAYRYCTTTDAPEEPADAAPFRVLVWEEGLRIVGLGQRRRRAAWSCTMRWAGWWRMGCCAPESRRWACPWALPSRASTSCACRMPARCGWSGNDAMIRLLGPCPETTNGPRLAPRPVRPPLVP